jgi:hypothetical protein
MYDMAWNQAGRLDNTNWQEQAMQDLALDWGRTMGEEGRSIELGGNKVSHLQGLDYGGIQEDPRYKAMEEAFTSSTAPMLANMAALSGLGTSGALPAAMGLAFNQRALPVATDVANAMERRNVRVGDALSEQANRFFDLGGRKRGARSEALGALGEIGGRLRGGTERLSDLALGLGDREQQRMLDQIRNLMDVGGTMRGIRQEQSDADYNEWLRKAAAFEQALGGPFGMIPSTFGSKATSDKPGLFG